MAPPASLRTAAKPSIAWETRAVEVSARVENGGFKPSIAEMGSSELFGGK